MKTYIIFIVLPILLTGCGLDNYEGPSSSLYGQFVFEGEPLQLRGTGEAIQIQLYQDGYELNAPIPVYVHQDGSFEAKLFDGVYKMVTRDNNGPWVNSRDTTVVTVSGATQMNMEVTPYFTVSDVSIHLNGNTLDGLFTINKIVPGAEVNYSMLLLSKTNFVDDVVYIGRLDESDSNIEEPFGMSMDVSGIKEVAEDQSLFARIGVRAVGVDQAIYSNVIQVR